MYTKGYASYEINVRASYGPDFYFVSYGASLTGRIASGNSYIQGNSITGSNLARFERYKNFKPCNVNLYIYFSVNILWWKKTYDSTLNVYIGHSSHDGDYFYK